MSWHLILIAALAVFFYAALPALGAFLARAQWRRFRTTVTAVSHYPTVTVSSAGRDKGGGPGLYRFFGTLEAIQGDDRIWLTNGKVSVAADLRGVRVYLVPEGDGTGDGTARGSSNAELGSVPWSRIFSLPEGTPVFVGGALFPEDGRGVFRSDGRARLLVAIYDCPREDVLPFAISGGRQRNEIMNQLTLPSAAIGTLALLLLAFTLLALPERIMALVAMTAALIPLAPFLPPGVPLYFAYRSFWKNARLMRVQRDMVQLPLRYFPDDSGQPREQRATLLPDMEPYLMARGTRSPDDPGVLLSAGTRIMLPADLPEPETQIPGPWFRGRGKWSPSAYVAFAGYEADDKGIRLKKPEDPLAQMVLLRGDPRQIARESQRAALRYEVIAVALISIDVAISIPAIFLLLSLIIR